MSVPPFNTNSAQPTLSQFDSDLSLSVEVMTPFVTLANSIDGNPTDYNNVSAAVQAYSAFITSVDSGPLLAQIEANPGLSSAFQGAQAAANTDFNNFEYTTNPFHDGSGNPVGTTFIATIDFNVPDPTVNFTVQVPPNQIQSLALYPGWLQASTETASQFYLWTVNGAEGSFTFPSTPSSPYEVVVTQTANGGLLFTVNGAPLSSLVNSGGVNFSSTGPNPMSGLQNFLNNF